MWIKRKKKKKVFFFKFEKGFFIKGKKCKMVHFAAECFSGECGLCHSCSSPMTKDKTFSKCPEPLKRGRDMATIMGDKLPEHYDKYHTILKRIRYLPKERVYLRDTFPKNISYEAVDERRKYHLIKGSHGAICDDPVCKALYVSSDDSVHTFLYPHIPVYTRTSDDKCQLCVVCMNRKQPWWGKHV
jgi:hypothetical protein